MNNDKPQAALSQQPAAQGWKLVPVEPTAEMSKAFYENGDSKETWRAMLAAVPAAPSPHSSVNEMELVDHLVKALEYYTDAVCEGETCGGGYYATEFDGQTARDALALVAAHRARKGEQG